LARNDGENPGRRLRGSSRRGTAELRNNAGEQIHAPEKISSSFFVDAIFTILFERLFTNVFVVTAQPVANPCLYPACNAD
jgi:hypothetical protein